AYRSPLMRLRFPYTTLFRSPRVRLVLELGHLVEHVQEVAGVAQVVVRIDVRLPHVVAEREGGERRHLRDQSDDLHVADVLVLDPDRKSTRLNSSHQIISYAV